MGGLFILIYCYFRQIVSASVYAIFPTECDFCGVVNQTLENAGNIKITKYSEYYTFFYR